jgi:hypothetical protein
MAGGYHFTTIHLYRDKYNMAKTPPGCPQRAPVQNVRPRGEGDKGDIE